MQVTVQRSAVVRCTDFVFSFFTGISSAGTVLHLGEGLLRWRFWGSSERFNGCLWKLAHRNFALIGPYLGFHEKTRLPCSICVKFLTVVRSFKVFQIMGVSDIDLWYRQKTAMEQNPRKFSEPFCAEIMVGSENVWRCRNGTGMRSLLAAAHNRHQGQLRDFPLRWGIFHCYVGILFFRAVNNDSDERGNLTRKTAQNCTCYS